MNESFDHIAIKVQMDLDPAVDPSDVILTAFDLELERKRRWTGRIR